MRKFWRFVVELLLDRLLGLALVACCRGGLMLVLTFWLFFNRDLGLV